MRQMEGRANCGGTAGGPRGRAREVGRKRCSLGSRPGLGAPAVMPPDSVRPTEGEAGEKKGLRQKAEDRSRDSHQRKCRCYSAERACWPGGTRGMRPEGEPGMWVRPCGVHPNQQEGKWKDGNQTTKHEGANNSFK